MNNNKMMIVRVDFRDIVNAMDAEDMARFARLYKVAVEFPRHDGESSQQYKHRIGLEIDDFMIVNSISNKIG